MPLKILANVDLLLKVIGDDVGPGERLYGLLRAQIATNAGLVVQLAPLQVLFELV